MARGYTLIDKGKIIRKDWDKCDKRSGMKKCKCGNDTFKIIESFNDSCNECRHNGAYDKEKYEYIYDLDEIKNKNLIRDQADQEGECNIGNSNGCGCSIYICAKCRDETNLPYIDY